MSGVELVLGTSRCAPWSKAEAPERTTDRAWWYTWVCSPASSAIEVRLATSSHVWTSVYLLAIPRGSYATCK